LGFGFQIAIFIADKCSFTILKLYLIIIQNWDFEDEII
jgi:hypothetical protein